MRARCTIDQFKVGALILLSSLESVSGSCQILSSTQLSTTHNIRCMFPPLIPQKPAILELPANTLSLDSALQVRGGSASDMIMNIKNFIGDNKMRCWIVLFVAILTDTFSTTLMKMAQDESSVTKLLVAYCGFLFALSCFGLCLGGIDVSIAYAVRKTKTLYLFASI